MIRHWRKLFIIGILLAVAIWSWQHNRQPPDQQKFSTKPDDNPLEYFVRDFEIITMDIRGQPERSLQADEMLQYSKNKNTVLQQPKIKVYAHDKRPAWNIQAQTGTLSDNGQRLFLGAEVIIDRQAIEHSPAIHLVTSDLTLFPEKNYAETDAPVQITSGSSWINSTGMQAWMGESAHIKFSSKTRGHYAASQN